PPCASASRPRGRDAASASWLRLGLLALVGRRRQVGELVGEGGAAVVAVAEAEALEVAVAGEAELGRQLRLVEQPDLLGRRPRNRLRRLDLEPPVAPKAGGRRDQLPDDDV